MDPDVFGPPGSGSVIICKDPDPDPSINKQKMLEKHWFQLYFNYFLTIFLQFFDFFIWNVNEHLKSKKQKNFEKKIPDLKLDP